MTCWDEARPANACYAPMAREMALEAAAAASENPASHTMVSSRIFHLTVNGALWGEFEMYAHAAAYRGVPTLFASGDAGMCAAAARTVPGLLTVPTKSGHGYGVLTKTPELVRLEIEGMMARLWRRQRQPHLRRFPTTSLWRSPMYTIMTPTDAPTIPAPASSLPPPWSLMPTITVMYCAFSTL